MQEAVFNGSRAARSDTYVSQLYKVKLNDSNGQFNEKVYKFYGQAIHSERSREEAEVEGRTP